MEFPVGSWPDWSYTTNKVFRGTNGCNCIGVTCKGEPKAIGDIIDSIYYDSDLQGVHLNRTQSTNVSVFKAFLQTKYANWSFFEAGETACECIMPVYKASRFPAPQVSSVEEGKDPDWIIGSMQGKCNPALSEATALAALIYTYDAHVVSQWCKNIKADNRTECLVDQWLMYSPNWPQNVQFYFTGCVVEYKDFKYTSMPRSEDASWLGEVLIGAHSVISEAVVFSGKLQLFEATDVAKTSEIKLTRLEQVQLEGEKSDIASVVFICAFTENLLLSSRICVCNLLGKDGFVTRELEAGVNTLEAIDKLIGVEMFYCECYDSNKQNDCDFWDNSTYALSIANCVAQNSNKGVSCGYNIGKDRQPKIDIGESGFVSTWYSFIGGTNEIVGECATGCDCYVSYPDPEDLTYGECIDAYTGLACPHTKRYEPIIESTLNTAELGNKISIDGIDIYLQDCN